MKEGLNDYHVGLFSADIYEARRRNINISATIRNLFHDFITAPDSGPIKLSELEEEANQLRQKHSEVITALRQKESLLAAEKNRLEKEEQERRDLVAQKQRELVSCCVCGDLLTSSVKKQRVPFGPHMGRWICGFLRSGCYGNVWMGQNKWWLSGPDKSNGIEMSSSMKEEKNDGAETISIS